MFSKEYIGAVFNTESIENEKTTESFFNKDNNHILEKGSIRHTIFENDEEDIPTTTISREYSAFDGSLQYKEQITVASSVFNERKKMIVGDMNITARMSFLSKEIKKYSDKESYEICQGMKVELDKLAQLLKKKDNG
jgi:hypothetical protein